MKISKRAEQHNINLNAYYYSNYELKTMLENKEIFYLNDEWEIQYEMENYVEMTNVTFRIFLEKGDELKVVLDKYGQYKNVLIKDGKKYFVTL